MGTVPGKAEVNRAPGVLQFEGQVDRHGERGVAVTGAVAYVPVGGHAGVAVRDVVHRIQHPHVVAQRIGDGGIGIASSQAQGIVGEVDAAARGVAELLVLAAGTARRHALAVEGGRGLEGRGADHVVEVFVEVQVNDVLALLPATATHALTASTAGTSLGPHAARATTGTPVRGRHAVTGAAEGEAERVGDVGACVLGVLGALDEQALQVVAVVVGREGLALGSLEVKAVEILGIEGGQLLGDGLLLTADGTRHTVGHAIEPLVGHVGMVEVGDGTEAYRGIDVVTLVGGTHGPEQRFVVGMVARSPKQRGHGAARTGAVGDDALGVARHLLVEVAQVAHGGLEVQDGAGRTPVVDAVHAGVAAARSGHGHDVALGKGTPRSPLTADLARRRRHVAGHVVGQENGAALRGALGHVDIEVLVGGVLHVGHVVEVHVCGVADHSSEGDLDRSLNALGGVEREAPGLLPGLAAQTHCQRQHGQHCLLHDA